MVSASSTALMRDECYRRTGVVYKLSWNMYKKPYHHMMVQHEFCCTEGEPKRRAVNMKIDLPSWQSCRTSCSALIMHLSAPPDCLASLHVAELIQSSYARRNRSISYENMQLGNSINTKTILVSSSSCWTFMIASACRGSWYFCMYVAISGNDIEAGFENDDWGILDVNSSSNLVRSENAPRTGYSWSVIMTPERLHHSH